MGYMELYCQNYLSGGLFWSDFDNVIGGSHLDLSQIASKIASLNQTVQSLDESLVLDDTLKDAIEFSRRVDKGAVVSVASSYIGFKLNEIKEKLNLKLYKNPVVFLNYTGSFSFSQGLQWQVEELEEKQLQEYFEFSGGALVSGVSYDFDFEYQFNIAVARDVEKKYIPNYSIPILSILSYILAILSANPANKNIIDKMKLASNYDNFISAIAGFNGQPENDLAVREGTSLAELILQAGDFVTQSADISLQIIDIGLQMKEKFEEDWDDREKADMLNKIYNAVTDEKSINTVLGKALNYNVDGYNHSYPVIKRKDSTYTDIWDGELFPHEHYDFSHVLDISQDKDGSHWLSKQALLALQYNWQFGEEF